MAHRLQPAEDYNGGVIFYGLGNFIFGGHTNPGNGTDPGAYDTGIAQLTLKRVGGEVTLDSYSFIPCSLSSTVGPDSTVLGPNTLNNYQPQPYTEGGDAMEPRHVHAQRHLRGRELSGGLRQRPHRNERVNG